MKPSFKAIIFDWGRTLYDSETKKEFLEAEDILALCKERGYRLALVSLVTIHANATLDERKNQIANSPLRKYFEIVAITDTDKDKSFDGIVRQLNLSREEILIIDDRTVRGIRYGNLKNHPTVWLQQGKFANELPNEKTGRPTFTIRSLEELVNII